MDDIKSEYNGKLTVLMDLCAYSPSRYSVFEGSEENPRYNGSRVLTGAELLTFSYAQAYKCVTMRV